MFVKTSYLYQIMYGMIGWDRSVYADDLMWNYVDFLQQEGSVYGC